MSTIAADAPRSPAATPRSAPPVRRPRPRGRLRGHLLSVLAWAAGLLFFAPVAWMVLTSFKQESQAASNQIGRAHV